MRDREQRLNWIERLIGASYQGPDRQNALVVPTAAGELAIAFSSIVEVVPASEVQTLALLPDDYCGVLTRGNVLAPIIDTSGNNGPGSNDLIDADGGSPDHAVLVEGAGCVFGLRFSGTPSVVDLNATEHVTLRAERRESLPPGALPLLDVEAVAEALLALD